MPSWCLSSHLVATNRPLMISLAPSACHAMCKRGHDHLSFDKLLLHHRRLPRSSSPITLASSTPKLFCAPSRHATSSFKESVATHACRRGITDDTRYVSASSEVPRNHDLVNQHPRISQLPLRSDPWWPGNFDGSYESLSNTELQETAGMAVGLATPQQRQSSSRSRSRWVQVTMELLCSVLALVDWTTPGSSERTLPQISTPSRLLRGVPNETMLV